MKVVVILTLCLLHAVTTTQSASCKGGTISNLKCEQSCRLDDCYCNTTNDAKYDTCNQDCSPPNCFSFNDANKITCIAEKNCSQTCQPGKCAMTCNAQDYCDQKADSNGAKIMSCSSKGCTQSCMEGNCDIMFCEADHCYQTCGKGGCTMNCTESVKMCSQICLSEEKCTLECRAEVCQQKCSGPKQCIIVNAAPSRVTTTQSASCKGGTISNHKCEQSCRLNDCYCNSTNDAKFDTCDQDCSPPNCFSVSDVNKITCIAEKNCSQTCQPGKCAMTCNAQDYCDQKADSNGAKIMSCSSKGCTQSCMEGNCDIMFCEADHCYQTCGKGGCTMNCTERVKMCSQNCSSEEKCTLECRAEDCQQKCSGPKQCIIVNASPSRVRLHFALLNIVCFLLLMKQCDYM